MFSAVSPEGFSSKGVPSTAHIFSISCTLGRCTAHATKHKLCDHTLSTMSSTDCRLAPAIKLGAPSTTMGHWPTTDPMRGWTTKLKVEHTIFGEPCYQTCIPTPEGTMRIHTLHLHLGLVDELGMHIVCTVLCKIWIGMWFMVCAAAGVRACRAWTISEVTTGPWTNGLNHDFL